MLSENLKQNLIEILDDSISFHNIEKNKGLSFIDTLISYDISKELTYKILDTLALHDDVEFLNIFLKEYRKRCIVFSVSLREYPELFNRRIYIPIRYNLEEFMVSILSSLRISNYEECYIHLDGRKYTFDGENRLSSLSVLSLRDAIISNLVYGKDLWTFDIKMIGLTYYNEGEVSMPYLVIDGVGYGIEGMSKKKLFSMLDESIELSLDTKNPIMDDEDFEFYNADTDNLNENAQEDYNFTLNKYLKIDK